ncbi:uncharacterized protein G2W53_034008 [Senna tora]|uniref:Uncharacterized protein n=1 Tax=Senna tora TaxID=362788 RepID=A0A834T3B4_9FABA|nr:uncharacterized protein G2W53_034008 [Senna tora]
MPEALNYSLPNAALGINTD